jgi:hypothetical protein
MRSEYRFPRSLILLMLLVLVGVLMAIENARKIASGDASAVSILPIARFVIAAIVLMWVVGVGCYAVVRVIRSGLHRG